MTAAEPAGTSARAFDDLLAARAVAHRTVGNAPMESLEEVHSWLDEVGMALVSGRGALPSAAEAIAAGQIDGSWWSHPEGDRIYRLLNGLEEAPMGALELALFEGKRTLIAPALVPAVQALAADCDRRERVVSGLPIAARRLLEDMRRGHVPRSDDTRLDRRTWRAARAALEAGLLASSSSEHTRAGRHVAVLELFDPVPGQVSDPLSVAVRASIAASVVAERRQILRGFRAVEPDGALLEAAVDVAGARSLSEGGRAWLTLRGG